MTLTLADYWKGRDTAYAHDLTPEIRANAEKMVGLASELLLAFGQPRPVSSGWRPPAMNAGVPGAAKKSNHMLGLAIDLKDADGSLDAWCMSNLDVLKRLGLYLEHPEATVGWCHVQCVAPRSGNRVFRP